MTIKITQPYKPQWQYNTDKVYRVKIFSRRYDIAESSTYLYDQGLAVTVINELKDCPKCQWVDQNDVKLLWETADNAAAWCREVIIYAVLTERQFVEYTLRFN